MPSIDTTLQSKELLERENAQIGVNTSRFMPRSEYTASTFSSEKYNVMGLSYPQDIMESDEYGYNKAIFYINVASDSRVIRATGGGAETVDGVQRDMKSELVGKSFTQGEIVSYSAVVGAVGGAITGFKDKERFSTLLGAVKGGAVGGGLAAITSGAVLSNVNNQEADPGQEKAPVFTRPQKRLKAAIALYVPNQMSVRYSASWGEEDTRAFQMAGEIARVAGSGQELARAVMGNGGKIGSLVKDVLGSLAIDKAPLGGSMGIATGLAPNPKKEQAFKNVDFRSFTFEYQFAPRSEVEAQNVLNIIRAFKYHMHPEFKNDTGFLYTYPSEFDIVYYKGTTENLNLHRHTSCVLTEMNVNYSPNGVFSTFPNGMPTQISLTLGFRELMILTKESIERFA